MKGDVEIIIVGIAVNLFDCTLTDVLMKAQIQQSSKENMPWGKKKGGKAITSTDNSVDRIWTR